MEIAIHSRRQIISGLMLALFPGLMSLGANSAMARNGTQSEGNGRGGNSDGSGKGGGSAGDKNGKGQGSGNSGNRGRSSDASSGAGIRERRSQNDTVSTESGSIRVRHDSGIAEEVNDRGRYVMRDRSGRTIVNRAATRSDFERLRSLTK